MSAASHGSPNPKASLASGTAGSRLSNCCRRHSSVSALPSTSLCAIFSTRATVFGSPRLGVEDSQSVWPPAQQWHGGV